MGRDSLVLVLPAPRRDHALSRTRGAVRLSPPETGQEVVVSTSIRIGQRPIGVLPPPALTALVAMARTVTLRLSDSAYEAVKRYADADQKSMNSWIESVLDTEDMRRRCEAHDRWLQDHPEAAAFSEAWGDRNLGALTKR